MAPDLVRVLVAATITSSSAIVLVLALRKPLRARLGARVAYALWALVPLAAFVALLPAPTGMESMRILPTATITIAATPVASGAPQAAIDAASWLAGLWLLGAGFMLSLFVLQQHRFVRRLGRLTAAGADTLRAETAAGCPALIGAIRPRVVLPVDFEQRYDANQRALILAHERSHRRRGDAQLNALAAAMRCLFWFNPLIHVAASRFRFDQELACDAAVISRFPEARRSYADAMLKTQLAALGLPAGCHWQSSHPLKERIAMLKQPLPGAARTALGACMAAALIAGGTFAAWAVQPAASSTSAAAAAGQDHPGASYRKLSRIDYPAAAVAAGVEGIVYVKAHVDADGTVGSASAERIDPPGAKALADVAVAGVRNWTFNPARTQGHATSSDEIIPIVFSLHADAGVNASGGTLEPIKIAPAEAHAAAATPDQPTATNMTSPPRYPQAAIDAHQQGKITLKVLVDARGNPQSAEVYDADPPEAKAAFADASIDAAMHWKFNPALEAGRPVAGAVLVPITFSLDDND